MSKLKNSLWLVWGVILLLFVGGIFCAASPFLFDGGVMGLFFPLPAPDAWLNYLLNVALSVVVGIVLIVASGVTMLVTGISLSVLVSTSSRKKHTRPELSNEQFDAIPENEVPEDRST